MKKENCRLCNSKDLELKLKLQPTPLATEFVKNACNQDCIDLDLYQCLNCKHYQLLEIVDPNRLFNKYVYTSEVSKSVTSHFKNYADLVKEKFLEKNDLIIDIGSNDGTFLKNFNEYNILGIDPATEIAKTANKNGINTINSFLTVSLANDICNKYGKAKVITANNVFADIDNLNEAIYAVKKMLKKDGVFIFEVSYFYDVMKKTLFDTIYHEHLSYHTINPLIMFFKKHNLELFKVDFINTHGGSIRGYVSFSDIYKNEIIEEKIEPELFTQFCKNIDLVKNQLKQFIEEKRDEGAKFAGYGAPAKMTTLMYNIGLSKYDIEYIVDDSELKQGLLSPGKNIKIVNSNKIMELNSDYLIIFAWEMADEIIEKNNKFKKNGGKFIIPLPEFKII